MKVIFVIIAVLILGGILFPLFTYFRTIKKENSKVEQKGKSKGKGKKEENKRESVREDEFEGVPNDSIVRDSRELLEFEEIIVCNDDEAILKVAENEYVAYLEVNGVSYNLLSYEEKLSLEETYGSLLNGIDFEFQNYIQSRSLNLDNYINRYQDRINLLQEKGFKLKEKYELSETEKEKEKLIDDIEKLSSQLVYGKKLLNDFVNKYLESHLLERKYYIVLKYFHDPSEFKELSDLELIRTVYSNLYNKANIFIDTFQRSNMRVNMLSALEIADLLYSSFNKDESNILKLENLVKAKYNHLCTTSTPVDIKQILNEKKKIEEEQIKLEKDIKDKAIQLEKTEDILKTIVEKSQKESNYKIEDLENINFDDIDIVE